MPGPAPCLPPGPAPRQGQKKKGSQPSAKEAAASKGKAKPARQARASSGKRRHQSDPKLDAFDFDAEVWPQIVPSAVAALAPLRHHFVTRPPSAPVVG